MNTQFNGLERDLGTLEGKAIAIAIDLYKLERDIVKVKDKEMLKRYKEAISYYKKELNKVNRQKKRLLSSSY